MALGRITQGIVAHRSECDESMTMDFNKGVDVAQAACVCMRAPGMLEHKPDREDRDKEIVTNINVRSQ